MHDIKAIRDNPQPYDKGWASRGLSPQTPAILALDAELRSTQTMLQAAQSHRNDASRLIGMAKSRKDEVEAQRLMTELEGLKTAIAPNTEAEARLTAELHAILAALPNLPAADVPPGEDEHGNREIRRYGEPFKLETVRDHVDLGSDLGGM